MNKTLDIIIPAYNSHNTIVVTLSSIAIQEVNFNFNVIIVNDNSDKDYNEEIKLFSDILNIKEITLKENKGVGVVRQIGLDNSTSNYIMFIDSDDVLYSENALQTLYDLMQDGIYDYAYGKIIVEENGSKNVYQEHSHCLHGSIINRDLILRNNIRFNTTRTSEDNSFNHICIFNSNNINTTEEIVYIYKESKLSLTKGISEKKKIDNIIDFIDNVNYTINNVKDKFDENILLYYINSIYYIWNEYSFYKNISESTNILKKIIELDNNCSFYTSKLLEEKYPDCNIENIRELINYSYKKHTKPSR